MQPFLLLLSFIFIFFATSSISFHRDLTDLLLLCFALILYCWTISLAKENDRTLIYKLTTLCKTSFKLIYQSTVILLWYISLQLCAKHLFGHDCLTHSYYCRNARPICTSLQTSLKQINVCLITETSLTDSRTKQTTTKNTDLQLCLEITDRPLDDNDRERTYNNGKNKQL